MIIHNCRSVTAAFISWPRALVNTVKSHLGEAHKAIDTNKVFVACHLNHDWISIVIMEVEYQLKLSQRLYPMVGLSATIWWVESLELKFVLIIK